jgi:hypothetical protein
MRIIIIGAILIGIVYAVFYTPIFNLDLKEQEFTVPTYRGLPKKPLVKKEIGKKDDLQEIEKESAEPKEKGPIILRDPFDVNFVFAKPAKGTAKGTTTRTGVISGRLSLQGIFVVGDTKAAIVNDRVVYEGDKVSGWRVHRISDKTVVLKKGSATRTLRLAD